VIGQGQPLGWFSSDGDQFLLVDAGLIVVGDALTNLEVVGMLASREGQLGLALAPGVSDTWLGLSRGLGAGSPRFIELWWRVAPVKLRIYGSSLNLASFAV
jgi:hypothetical protein